MNTLKFYLSNRYFYVYVCVLFAVLSLADSHDSLFNGIVVMLSMMSAFALSVAVYVGKHTASERLFISKAMKFLGYC